MRLENKKATLQILASNRPPNKAKLYSVSRKQKQNKKEKKIMIRVGSYKPQQIQGDKYHCFEEHFPGKELELGLQWLLERCGNNKSKLPSEVVGKENSSKPRYSKFINI